MGSFIHSLEAPPRLLRLITRELRKAILLLLLSLIEEREIGKDLTFRVDCPLRQRPVRLREVGRYYLS